MPAPPALASQADLQSLFALFGERRYADMEARSVALSQRFPADGNVWKALSVARQVQGRDAVPALRQAIALLPRDAELRSNLGALLSDAGDLDAAVDSYRTALALAPDFADAHGNLGVAFNRLGRHAEAAGSLSRALQLKPAFAEAEYNLGNALLGLARADEALGHYERALRLRAGFADAVRGRANGLLALGRVEEAADSLSAAVARHPGDALAHAALAAVEQQQGRFEAAAASYQNALAIKPGNPAWQFELGNALAACGRAGQAVAAWRLALAHDPFAPAAPAILNNLGNALVAAGALDEAPGAYRRAIALAPEATTARLNLARLLRQTGAMDEAFDQFRLVVAQQADDLAAHSDMLFVQNYMSCLSPARILADARAFGARAAAAASAPSATPPASTTRSAPLRIGFVSGDLREHPVGYFAETVLVALAAAGAAGQPAPAVFVYASDPVRDAVSGRIGACCQGWCDISAMDDQAAAARIAADAIDILIDLAGHTAGNRLPLFAWRPAPVQLSWLGYCATTGLDAIDAVLVDPHIAPAGAEAQYAERLWRLPETFLCFTPPTADIAPGPLPALAGGGITFGCFNKLSKLNDEVIALWSRVLLAVPGSRLMLKASPLAAASVRLTLAGRFGRHGVDPARLLFEGSSPRAAYLAAYHRVDIALDPFPYPGGTTSVEGLWMGVPVLTLAGVRSLARQGVSIMRNVGLDDWIATDEDDYVARACAHAGDLSSLASLRAGLRQRLLASPLCDAPRFARHLLAALTAMLEAPHR